MCAGGPTICSPRWKPTVIRWESLEEAAELYEKFQKKQDGCNTVVLRPCSPEQG